MIQSCILDTPIAPSYFRNNRSTRQKSLRCFPVCSLRGHVSGGFCGQSLRANLVLTNPPVGVTEHSATGENVDGNGTINNSFHNHPPLNLLHANASTAVDVNEYLFIAEIRPANKARISGQTVISKTDIMSQIRTKVENKPGGVSRELFLGEVSIVQNASKHVELNVVFNSQHHSWDYGWRSNRWSATNEKHVVDIIVLRYNAINSSDFMVSSCYTSSPFYIISSHKKPGQKLVSSDMEVIDASRVLSNLAEIGSDNPSDNSTMEPTAKGSNKRTTEAAMSKVDSSNKDEEVIMSTKRPAKSGKRANAKSAATGTAKDKEENIAESAQTLINMSMLVQPLNYEYDARNNGTGAVMAAARTASASHADKKRKLDAAEQGGMAEYQRMISQPMDPSLFSRMYGSMMPNLYPPTMPMPSRRDMELTGLGRYVPMMMTKTGEMPTGYPGSAIMAPFPPTVAPGGMFLSAYPGLPAANHTVSDSKGSAAEESSSEAADASSSSNNATGDVIMLPGRN